MCGIAGIVSLNGSIDVAQLNKMSAAIAHRGPDADGVFVSDAQQCGLAHRRLSIIDLSADANQPMTDASGRYTLVFNGEVYNFEAIKAHLQKEGATFSTSSDSEVVLQAYIHWGTQCVDEFNGMFAFAIWDDREKSLALFRDRIGIKPLYYFWDGKTFAFGSEIKSLTAITNIQTWNKKAIAQYFQLGYVPAPMTIYHDIHKFEQGSYMVLNRAGLEKKKYWCLSDQIEKNTVLDRVSAKATLTSLIERSIDLRLKSDVPFGVFLSGGIDSSTVAAIAQDRSVQNINTFSIGFKEAQFNESEHAQKVANHLGTHHHEYTVSQKDAQDLITKIPEWYDEPYADTSAIPTFMVSKLAKEKVTMVLTGDGGDEQFLGYGRYAWKQRLQNPLVQFSRLMLKTGFKNLPQQKWDRAGEYFNYGLRHNLNQHIFSVDQSFYSSRECDHYFQLTSPEPRDQISFQRELSPAEQQAFYDLNYYLPDDLLTKVDRVTMQNGIEARVPLLDHNIVAYALNIDPSLKLQGKSQKWLLKQVLYDYVPQEYFDRPKWGFGIPLQQWLSDELRFLLEDYVNEKVLAKYDFYNVEEIL
ncbi:MAG: asparagine synthase (glutamine-hydrolyzing), partial [Bacteroidota bacterium]